MDYINESRKGILLVTGKQTDQLFTSLGGGSNFHNMTDKLMRILRKQDNNKRCKAAAVKCDKILRTTHRTGASRTGKRR